MDAEKSGERKRRESDMCTVGVVDRDILFGFWVLHCLEGYDIYFLGSSEMVGGHFGAQFFCL